MKKLSPLTLKRSLALAFLATAPMVSAANLYYGPSGNGQASGAWDVATTLDWSTAPGGSAIGWTNGNSAIFGGTAGTVTTASGVSATGLTFNVGGYTIAGSALTLRQTVGFANILLNAGTTTISAPIINDRGLNISGGNTLVLTGGITATPGLPIQPVNITGAGTTVQVGTVAADGATGYSASTQIGAGSKLIFDGNNAANLGSGFLYGAGDVQIGTGLTSFAAGYFGFNVRNAITGVTTVNISSGSAWPFSEIFINTPDSLSSLSVLNMQNGRIDLRSSPTVAGLTGGSNAGVLISGDSNGGVLTLGIKTAVGQSYNYQGTISDTVAGATGSTIIGINKLGAGTQTFSGASTYTNGTTVSGGVLQLLNNTGSLASTGALTFAGNGTFLYDGTGSTGAKTQNLGALTFAAGSSGTVQSTLGSATSQTLTLASESRTAGGVGNFIVNGGVNGTSNKIVLTGKSAGYLDQGTFFNLGATGGTYAVYDAASFVRGFNYATDTGGTSIAGGANLGATTSASHVFTSGAITAQGTATVGTVQIDGANNFTQTAGSTLTTTGILKTGNNASTISGGTLDTGSSTDLVLAASQTSDVLTVGSVISSSGAGGLTVGGNGTVILTGANTYTGNTSVGGTLQIGNGTSGALASGYAGNFAVGGNLNLDLASATTYTGTVTGPGTITQMANNVTLSGSTGGFTGVYNVNAGKTLQVGTTTAPQSFLSATVNVASGGTFIFDGNTQENVTSNLSGAGNFQLGTGSSSWAGSYVNFNPISNTLTGQTIVNIATVAGTSWPNGEIFINNPYSLSATSELVMQNGKIDLRADNTIGGLSGTNATTVVSSDGQFGSAYVTLTDNTATGQTYTYAGLITNKTDPNAGAAQVAFTKTGSGTQILTAINSYTGATIVQAGSLIIDGRIATSATTVQGGLLGGSGRVGSVNATGGTIAPGTVNSVGVLESTSDVTMSNATLQIQLNGATSDQLIVDNNLTLSAGSNLSLLTSGPITVGQMYTIVQTFGSISGVFTSLNGVTTNLAQNAFFTSGGYNFQISYTGDGTTFSGAGSDIMLQVASVPEPSTWALFGLGLAFLGFRLRRKGARVA